MPSNALNYLCLPIALGAFGTAIGLGYAIGGPKVAGLPVLTALAIPCFVIQWVAFIPAFLLQTEKFYDIVGSITYITMVTLSLLVAHFRGDGISPVAWMLASMVYVWAMRLGFFLVTRVIADGKDVRFDEIKTKFAPFFVAWSLQGLWVFLTVMAAAAGIAATERKGWSWSHYVGICIWAVGFAAEIIADHQKRVWRADESNRGKYIDVGLWSLSRHPNYAGEITLWVGVLVIAATWFTRGGQWVCVISPIFVFLLINFVSGVPLLEKKADEKWGGQPEYEKYKHRVPVLFPYPTCCCREEPDANDYV
eukprot:TRINITY_DN18267_c0_g1_i1.p2 TRINITY_DN18267_c0_g1~~TRINITY_DN18267_c0_g1_i1.p2  ORF type:complete len:308 (+),score=128.20 TRINITY_DN18267_c0_g1_i1:68-991(+)